MGYLSQLRPPQPRALWRGPTTRVATPVGPIRRQLHRLAPRSDHPAPMQRSRFSARQLEQFPPHPTPCTVKPTGTFISGRPRLSAARAAVVAPNLRETNEIGSASPCKPSLPARLS